LAEEADQEGVMNEMNDNDLLEELNRRFRDNKKALHDITVMNEKIEKLNIKLAESERLKTHFLSNIRNEINSPLTSILGMTRQLAGPVKDEKMRQLMAQMVYHEAFDLDFQLRNIFAAAELEAGETEMNSAQVDIGALVKSVMASFLHKSREKNLGMDFVCRGAQQDEERLLFVTDPEKLRLVVANLVANAIEYNYADKKVRIEVRREKDALHISVADEGIGIGSQDRERLFERFHQLDQGTAKKHRGHGLGLSVTKALIDMLGGKISASQPAGGGSMFHVLIPEAAATGSNVFSEDGNEFLFENGSTF
jgi:signal transduction histidine kinase